MTTLDISPDLMQWAAPPAADLDWQDRALCAEVDPDRWFPEKGASARVAKAVCRVCAVRAECLEYALETDQRFGIYGGTSEHERRELRRQFGDNVAAAVASVVTPAPRSSSPEGAA